MKKGKQALTEHQTAAKLAIRRAKQLEKKGFVFDYDKLARMQTKTLKKLYQSELMLKAQRFDLPTKEGKREGESESVSAKKATEYFIALKKEKRVRRELGLPKQNMELWATTPKAFERVLQGTKARTVKRWYSERDNRMIENYKKTLEHTLADSMLAAAVRKKIDEMGVAWTVQKLIDATADETNIAPKAVFDSKMGKGVSNYGKLQRFWELSDEDIKAMADEREEFEDEVDVDNGLYDE